MTSDFVTFLSDYGLQDEFVGVCRGVMMRIAPHIRVIDVHHNILRQDIRHGAIVLEQSVHYLPRGVHLAVVDPSVGSGRRAIVVRSGAGSLFVGPDNGLLLPAAESLDGIVDAFEITNPEYMLQPVSRTFQGRDVFAPAAAHLASGVDAEALGPEIPVDELVRHEIPGAWVHDDHLHAEVLQVDRFGNLQLNVGRPQLESIGLASEGSQLEVRLEGHRVKAPMCRTFADVSDHEYVLVEDSYSFLSLAINKGDAAAKLRAGAGTTVIVGPSHHG